MTVQIRNAVDADSAAIAQLLLAAFGDQEGPEIVELVENLSADPTAQPAQALVAVDDEDIVGHILFTAVQVIPEQPSKDAKPPPAAILAPLAVIPDRHGQGIGGALISAGLQEQRKRGTGLVFVLGYPAYYPRHGFTPAGADGFDAPYPIERRYADAWMVQALKPGLIDAWSGTVACAEALNDPKYWQA